MLGKLAIFRLFSTQSMRGFEIEPLVEEKSISVAAELKNTAVPEVSVPEVVGLTQDELCVSFL